MVGWPERCVFLASSVFRMHMIGTWEVAGLNCVTFLCVV